MKFILGLLAVFVSQLVLADDIPPLPGHFPHSKQQKSLPSTRLPGIGIMPGKGDQQDLATHTVTIQANKTAIFYVSKDYPNRIATPFASPKVIDQQTADVKVEGQSVYVTSKADKQAIALYVTGSNPNDPVVSLALIPKALPPQTIALVLDTPNQKVQASPSEGGGDSDDQTNAPTSYEDLLRSLLRQVALKKTPEGFVEGRLPSGIARFDKVIVFPESRYSGTTYDIFRYKVQNAINAQIELEESAFASENVRAVAFYPTSVLNKGESTEVFVIADKPQVEE